MHPSSRRRRAVATRGLVRVALHLRCKIRYRTLVRAKSSNFRRLVLGCIEADFCNQILIFQHFSRSTRFAILRTAQISKFQQILQNLAILSKIQVAHFVDLEKCCKMSIWLQKSALIRPRTSPPKFDQNGLPVDQIGRPVIPVFSLPGIPVEKIPVELFSRPRGLRQAGRPNFQELVRGWIAADSCNEILPFCEICKVILHTAPNIKH